MKFSKLAIPTLLLPAFLTGCAADLKQLSQTKLEPGKAEKAAIGQILDSPSVVQVKVPRNAFALSGVTEPMSEKDIKIEFRRATLQDACSILSKLIGQNIMIEAGQSQAQSIPGGAPRPGGNGQVAPQAASQNNSQITVDYSGKAKDLFRAISIFTGNFFVEDGGSIFVRKNETFSVVVPNYPDLLKEVEASVRQLGATSVTYDALTSTINFVADYNAYSRIKQYLKLVKDNAALVSLRVILVDVNVTGNKNMGVDWSKFSLGHGALQQVASSNSAAAGSSSDSTSSTAANVISSGFAAVLGDKGASLLFNEAKYGVSAVLNFIESYGDYSVVQNAFVETLSGKQGKLEVLTETPYVSQITVSNLTTGSSSTGQSAQTEKAKNGVEITVAPQYNKANGTLGISLKVGVFGVLRYINLSAGNQLGSITQPETSKKTVDTYLRMTPSQIAVIGGLLFDRETSDSSGLPADSYLTKASSKTRNKEELVVIVKPTIIEFTDL